MNTDLDSTTSTGGSDRGAYWGLRTVGPVVVIVVAWWVWLTPAVMEQWPVGFDTFRDTASVENILAGRWWVDPSLKGEPYWYAPLGAIVFAGICSVTGQDPLMVYASSILWFNMLLPVGWYVLGLRCWHRPSAGAVAVLMIGVGSRWWATHMTMPLTSIQGVVLLMVTLAVWQWSLDRGRGWAVWSVGVGVVLAICTWTHLVSGILAAGSIGIHAVLGERGKRSVEASGSAGRADLRRRMWVVASVCGVLVSPLAWHMLTLPRINRAPIEYMAGELRLKEFAIQSDALLLFPLAAIGLVSLWRHHRGASGWLIGYGLVGLVGQGLGYLRMMTGVAVPVVTPHEFQWHFQLAIGLFAAGGVIQTADWIVARLGRRLGGAGVRGAIGGALVLAMVAVSIGDGIGGLNDRKQQYWWSTGGSLCTMSAVDWIKENSSIDEVFLSSGGSGHLSYFIIGGQTGRKLMCLPAGHTNIAVSAEARIRDRDEMYNTTDIDVFRNLLAKYGVDYVMHWAGENRAAVKAWETRWQRLGVLEEVFRCVEDDVTIFRIENGPSQMRFPVRGS